MLPMNSTHSRNGADVLLGVLLRHGVDTVFAYPGGATLPLHQALTRIADRLRTILPRHEQGGGLAASAYTQTSGKPGVVFATSGPGATNLVTAIADAHRRCIPMLAITGQVHHRDLGKDAFQEIPIVSVCRNITKHHYLITRTEDIPRVLTEALHLATSGRPGPVIVDVPKNLQAQKFLGDETPEFDLPDSKLAAGAPWACKPEATPHPVLQRLWHLVRARRGLYRTYVTSGTGPALGWVAGSWWFPSARHWVATDSLGAIGYALPAALGVLAAQPGARVIAVDTPASFIANVHELACAFVEDLPAKVLLLHAEGADEPAVDFVALAQGFRAGGLRVRPGEDLDAALTAMLDHSGPFVLDVPLPTASPTHEAPVVRRRRGTPVVGG